MTAKLIFLSHIHEEKQLAILIKNSLEEEFSGFVDVFVSSDGVSIPAGSNFLKKIENGLKNCSSAIYLISPNSVKRNWINFELGAIWLRSLISDEQGGPDIPLIPICHSGSTPGTLPPPLNNLNAIIGTESSQLEFAFKSIQSALGGKGKLRTDFDDLAKKINDFQQIYTIGDKFNKLLKLLLNKDQATELVNKAPSVSIDGFDVELHGVPKNSADEARQLVKELKNPHITMTTLSSRIGVGSNGSVSNENIKITIPTYMLIEYRGIIL
ncbi:toll/interleukin-1 receptor domain-containing protein [Pseudomonas sp. BO3-4]|uniref:toll/interleukin-1 receptor domain-containing protein n=1 Tax=Pseudomonas sp. BO3-4 TaxID=3094916 RepID=UPI002A598F66|nr:toll/interleukin-1 receptor domain-containing protein [Pseudomonas sp. BO3-4]WPO32109.1 toll/interleukin-1 receptor domain-containing protein [Pseudomonas sp. BO3-4]